MPSRRARRSRRSRAGRARGSDTAPSRDAPRAPPRALQSMTIAPSANAATYSIRSSIVGSAQWTSSMQTSSGRSLARPSSIRRTPQKTSSLGTDQLRASDRGADAFERGIRVVEIADLVRDAVEPAQSRDELHQRPVRDARAVGQAASGSDERVPREASCELLGEARLADPGRPDDRDETAGARRKGGRRRSRAPRAPCHDRRDGRRAGGRSRQPSHRPPRVAGVRRARSCPSR